MASLQASSLLYSSVYAPKLSKKRSNIMATLQIPKQRPSSSNNLSIPNFKNGFSTSSCVNIDVEDKVNSVVPDTMAIEKLYVILEAVADRVEMHKNVGEQRDNWNSLLLTSINAMTLTAATMSAINITATPTPTHDHMPINLSSTLLYLAATGMLIIVNKIQPSQLAEEQRNAARLFQQLQNQIQRIIAIGNPTDEDVKEAIDKVLALDKAYPLPLLGVMLEKFPSNVEPAVWWPNQRDQNQSKANKNKNKKKHISSNSWNMNLEQEMREIIKVIRRKDKEEYLNLGRKALKLNKLLALTGPLLTGLAAVSSALLVTGGGGGGGWAASMLGIVGGALATAVNSIEHGGQVGMVFEMYRSNAGFFKQMEESIESNLIEDEVERRENGELLEMKVALQLGRSLSELRDLAASSSSSSSSSMEEFASKLF